MPDDPTRPTFGADHVLAALPASVLVLDPVGTVLYATAQTAALVGVPLDEFIGSSVLQYVTEDFAWVYAASVAMADDYAGVVLLMDTPGGSISGSRAIADAIVRYQERTGKKVVAYVQAMAASGGMYAMAPADLIISDHGTLIGSIGVIMGPFEYYRDVTGLTGNILTSGVITTGGITHEYLTQGTGKDFGNPFREMSEQERATYTNGIGIEYQAFVDYVAQHRGIPADRIVNELGAYLFDPQTAIDKGLVDEIMGRPDGFLRAAEVSGVDPSDTKVVSPAMPDVTLEMSELLAQFDRKFIISNGNGAGVR